mmetsp:Transcript_1316/g.1582  ORF Transcript_1316/g.1582 Transcript_1316/m.1582 type:complete len:96 (-) Transcript_1316:1714-2001(-)
MKQSSNNNFLIFSILECSCCGLQSMLEKINLNTKVGIFYWKMMVGGNSFISSSVHSSSLIKLEVEKARFWEPAPLISANGEPTLTVALPILEVPG